MKNLQLVAAFITSFVVTSLVIIGMVAGIIWIAKSIWRG